MATRSGSRGLEVDLVRASVSGDVLTVELRYRNPTDGARSISFPIEEASVIDAATARRYGPLKDETGQYMAAPLSTSKTAVRGVVLPRDDQIVWLKFPAPPDTQTISINLPDVGPFDDVRLVR